MYMVLLICSEIDSIGAHINNIPKHRIVLIFVNLPNRDQRLHDIIHRASKAVWVTWSGLPIPPPLGVVGWRG